jgi:hypothetical protein
VDEDNSGEIEFSEFCRVIEKHKEASASNSDEQDTLDAFVALGGNVSNSCCSLCLCLTLGISAFQEYHATQGSQHPYHGSANKSMG